MGDFFARIGRALAYPFVKLYEFVVWFFTSEYFFAVIPMLIAVVYPILWATRVLVEFEGNIYLLFDFVHYDWFFVRLCADWLVSFDHNFFTAITVGLIQVLLIVIAAIFETVVIYFLFLGIGSFIFVILQLVFWLALLIALPAFCVVYAIALLRRPFAGMRNLHIVVLIVTVLSVAIHFIFTFSNFTFACSCG